MADQEKKQSAAHPKTARNMESWKPGSEPDKAKQVGGTGDFGVPAGTGPSVDRDYASKNTKRSDPGAAQPYDWEHDGVRDHGAGARDSGPGSASGGDVDADIIGVGAGGAGVAASGPNDPPGADDTDGSPVRTPVPSRRQGDAVIEPARGLNQTGVGRVGGSKRVAGSTAQGSDYASGPPNLGPDAANNPDAEQDDSFAGEVSAGEALGQDLGIPPSSDTQGLPEENNERYPVTDDYEDGDIDSSRTDRS
jgi:hypothetical protein